MVTQKADGTVVFRFLRPHSKHVALVGEFNNWDTGRIPMKCGSDGWWRCELQLDPGCYQFLYVSDGEYHRDYAAFGLAPTEMGMNSVVKVDPPAMKVADVQEIAPARTSRTRSTKSRTARTKPTTAVAVA